MLEIFIVIFVVYVISLILTFYDGLMWAKTYEDLLIVLVISFIPVINTILVFPMIVKKFQSFFSKNLPWVK